MEPTATLGKLVLDEKNKFIGLCSSRKYKEKKCTWYKITEIESIGLYCVKPRMTMNGSVKCDCEFTCYIPKEARIIKTVVLTGICCKHHRSKRDPTKEEWDEPGVISMMRNLIVQTFVNEAERTWNMWKEIIHTANNVATEHALTLFMLTPDFNQETLDVNYQKLCRVFDKPEEQYVIRQYYKVLLSALSEKSDKESNNTDEE
jgi:hypothetical protein